MDVLLHNKARRAKIETSKGKIKFFQCLCRYFQMVLGNYSKLLGTKIAGTENWVWALFLEYSYALKLENRARRWRIVSRFQNFLWLRICFFLFTIFVMLTFTKKMLGVHKSLCCVNKKKLFHIEVTLRPKLCESRKNMLWQQNKLCDTQKRDSCWLNMFSVAQKRNKCWQKIVPAVYEYMLYWLTL